METETCWLRITFFLLGGKQDEDDSSSDTTWLVDPVAMTLSSSLCDLLAEPVLKDINDSRAEDSRASRSHDESGSLGEGSHATGVAGEIDQIIADEGRRCRLEWCWTKESADGV